MGGVVVEPRDLIAPSPDVHIHLGAAMGPEVIVPLGDLVLDMIGVPAGVVALRTELRRAVTLHRGDSVIARIQTVSSTTRSSAVYQPFRIPSSAQTYPVELPSQRSNRVWMPFRCQWSYRLPSILTTGQAQ